MAILHKYRNRSFVWVQANPNVRISDEKFASNKPSNLKRYTLTAYTGGQMNLNDLPHPVVFDLSGMRKAPNVPLLFNHDENVIVGHVDKLTIDKSKGVDASGIISGTNRRAREINANANNQFPWQLSLGLQAGWLDYYKKGEKVVVNGRAFNGPLFVARNGIIREISFCSMGADANTLATLQASAKRLNGSTIMPTFEEWCATMGMDPAALTEDQRTVLMVVYNAENKEESAEEETVTPTETASTNPEDDEEEIEASVTPPTPATPPNPTPVNANVSRNGNNGFTVIRGVRKGAVDEIKRINGIRMLSAKYGNPKTGKGKHIEVLAMANGWNLEKTELVMMRAARPSNVLLGANQTDTNNTVSLLEAALSQSGKLPGIEKRFDQRTLEAAHKRFKSRLSLQECLLEAALAGGYSGHRNVKANLAAILKAAFSTLEIPGILSNTANKFLMAGFMAVDETWRKISKITSVNDFKEITTYRGVGSFKFEKIGPDGLIPHAKLTETTYANKADTYAKMVAITRQDIINDDLGALTEVPRGIGRGGALQLNFVFWTEFLNNTGSFFVSGNNNVTTGALAIAGLNNIFSTFKKLKDEKGEYILATPKYLLVPVELEMTAEQLRTSTNLVGGSAATPEANPFAGKFEIITSPYLSNSAFTGNSAVAYYLLADPNDVPVIEVAFLDGVETPTVETADVDFNRLGIQMRGFFDFGIRKQEPRAGVRSTGA